MAHMARVAGTDYAVAGGKTLIDGTAYSVVATREVENSKLISGRVRHEQLGITAKSLSQSATAASIGANSRSTCWR